MTDFPLETSPAEVKQMQDAGEEFLLLDCRENDEYATAHIERAKLLPMSEIADRLPELATHRDQRVIVHCHHGGRSLRVVRWLREQGFAKAQNMAGGIDRWSTDVDPTVPRY
jgi:rhodanese-related sulfurtransferase